MKKQLLIVCALLINGAVNSQTYVWTQKANYGGGGRYAAFSFAIGTKGYVGSGITHIGLSYTYHTDFWEYDTQTNVWTQKANIPSPGRNSGSGFTIGQKGYVTVGWTPFATNTTYEYNPATNSWMQKANFGGSARYDAASFVIGSQAYVGCGYTPYSSDFWRFDPTNNAWTQVANIGGQGRSACKGFSIGNYGYVAAGGQQFTLYTSDLWQYDAQANTWQQKANIPNTGRVAPTAFSLNGYGFVGIGCTDQVVYNDFYSYNPNSNSWTGIPQYPGLGRIHNTSFVVGNCAYVSTGSSNIYPGGVDESDMWCLCDVTGVDENSIENNFTIAPNPTSGITTVNFNKPLSQSVKITVTDMQGKIAKTIDVSTDKYTIDLSQFAEGTYFINVVSKEKMIVKKIQLIK